MDQKLMDCFQCCKRRRKEGQCLEDKSYNNSDEIPVGSSGKQMEKYAREFLKIALQDRESIKGIVIFCRTAIDEFGVNIPELITWAITFLDIATKMIQKKRRRESEEK